MDFKYVILIGASAGGFPVITKILSTLDKNISAAVFVVLHISKSAQAEVIIQHLRKNSDMKCVIASNNAIIKKGHVYLAPPDHHLLLKKDKMVLTQGPHENRWRPSIDVLFRSAAAAYNARVIGIILTGLLDDGTSGMGAIKRSGGICIVQEFNEAEFNDMPSNVINHVEVDYKLPASDIPYVLNDLSTKRAPKKQPAPKEVIIEAEITERMTSCIDKLPEIGIHSIYTCPDCEGGLWEIKDDNVYRYRCHTGHVYSEKLLLETQSKILEESLWAVIRLIEERRSLLLAAAQNEKERGEKKISC